MDRIFTGFKFLDKHLNIRKGDLVVIGGRPAVGKTCLLCSIAKKNLNKKKILFFSMQTNRHRAVENISISDSVVNTDLYVYENIFDFEELLYKIVKHKNNSGVDIIFIDNFDTFLICSNCFEKKLVLKLLNLANELEVVIIISDTMIWNYRRYSIISDLRHKAFIKYANKIITINRPDKTATDEEIKNGLIKKNIAEITIDKNMDEYFSPIIKLRFDRDSLTFKDIP